ncbi:MAG: TraB/GumN family protein [Bacteroidota bacterium]
MTNSIFWQLSTIDSPTASTIVGTMHLSGHDALAHWPYIETLIGHYHFIYTESSLSGDAQAFLQNHMMLPDGVSYQHYLTTNRWRRMRDTFIRYYQIDISLYERVHPLFVISMIQKKILDDDGLALDQMIWDTAGRSSKTVVGIETPEEQVEVLRQLSLRRQYRELCRLSLHVSGQVRKLRRLSKAYRHMDIYGLYKMSRDSIRAESRILLADRNLRMADRIWSWHHENPSLFSFGAGHLAGANGVLAILKRRGASLRAISHQEIGLL